MNGATITITFQDQNRWSSFGCRIVLDNNRRNKAGNKVIEKDIIGGQF